MEAREDGESVEKFQALVYFFLVVSSISCIVFVFFICAVILRSACKISKFTTNHKY